MSPRPAVGWSRWRTLLRALHGDGLRMRAMALTYISLFAIVPAIVVAFSVVQAFTGMDALWRGIHGFLLDNLAVGARKSIEPYLDRFVRNAHATSAGVVGGALLVFSAVSCSQSPAPPSSRRITWLLRTRILSAAWSMISW